MPLAEIDRCSELVKVFWNKCVEADLFGKALAVVRLDYCFKTEDLPLYRMLPEMDMGNFSPGRYAWSLKDLQVFKQPWPIKGAQGLFDVPDEQIATHELGPS